MARRIGFRKVQVARLHAALTEMGAQPQAVDIMPTGVIRYHLVKPDGSAVSADAEAREWDAALG